MKKFTLLSIILICTALLLTSCAPDAESGGDRISVVATIFAPYDFARQIAGDHADITLLIPPGTESHSYEPTPQDIIKIRSCDVFIYVGGESDTWVHEVLESIDGDFTVVTLMDCVQPIKQEITDGMEHGHDEHDHEYEHDHDNEYDEHVWTSPKNAMLITDKIAAAMAEKDPENAEAYSDSARTYKDELAALDAQFRNVITSAERKTIVFGDRFPLLYFAREYGLTYYAAFPGCAGQTEPSAATMTFLINKIREENIPVVFKIELSNGNIAQTLSDETGAKILQFSVCHNVAKSDLDSGATYLKLMYDNLDALKEALN